MARKKMRCQKFCRNGRDGCGCDDPQTCVRFLPLDGTNLSSIDGVVETPPNIDSEKFFQYFLNWIDAMGWSFCGSSGPYVDTEE